MRLYITHIRYAQTHEHVNVVASACSTPSRKTPSSWCALRLSLSWTHWTSLPQQRASQALPWPTCPYTSWCVSFFCSSFRCLSVPSQRQLYQQNEYRTLRATHPLHFDSFQSAQLPLRFQPLKVRRSINTTVCRRLPRRTLIQQRFNMWNRNINQFKSEKKINQPSSRANTQVYCGKPYKCTWQWWSDARCKRA